MSKGHSYLKGACTEKKDVLKCNYCPWPPEGRPLQPETWCPGCSLDVSRGLQGALQPTPAAKGHSRQLLVSGSCCGSRTLQAGGKSSSFERQRGGILPLSSKHYPAADIREFSFLELNSIT